MELTKNGKDFITNAINKHGKKYDYSKVIYIRAKQRVEIICHVHGVFLQTPADHLAGGCNACAKHASGITRQKKSAKSFKDKCQKIHGSTYDYSESVYISAKEYIYIICPLHGKWKTTPCAHLNGHGCPSCKKTKISDALSFDLSNFLERANILFGDRYDYSGALYENARTNLNIICREHGVFKQTPDCHLNRKRGCPRCSDRWKSQNEWLDSLGIPNDTAHRQVKILLPCGKSIVADGYDANTKTIYEFWGTYYHGHPQFYLEHDMSFMGKSFGDLYAATADKVSAIRASGMNLVEIWEHEWKNKN